MFVTLPYTIWLFLYKLTFILRFVLLSKCPMRPIFGKFEFRYIEPRAVRMWLSIHWFRKYFTKGSIQKEIQNSKIENLFSWKFVFKECTPSHDHVFVSVCMCVWGCLNMTKKVANEPRLLNTFYSFRALRSR